ncbi:hypothetical protein Ciccas_007235 [Cichlidogyrus casuarinus]|uniref:Uncharacterized protein n=1 Tax=Cichlidogyrus casuarinus TaxID=1844966 RepID=A0ABD2Q429_9PLAT
MKTRSNYKKEVTKIDVGKPTVTTKTKVPKARKTTKKVEKTVLRKHKFFKSKSPTYTEEKVEQVIVKPRRNDPYATPKEVKVKKVEPIPYIKKLLEQRAKEEKEARELKKNSRKKKTTNLALLLLNKTPEPIHTSTPVNLLVHKQIDPDIENAQNIPPSLEVPKPKIGKISLSDISLNDSNCSLPVKNKSKSPGSKQDYNSFLDDLNKKMQTYESFELSVIDVDD